VFEFGHLTIWIATTAPLTGTFERNKLRNLQRREKEVAGSKKRIASNVVKW
jgi:hypothetical protein